MHVTYFFTRIFQGVSHLGIFWLIFVQAISDWAGSKNGLIGYGIYTMVENVHKYRLDLDPKRANKLVQLFRIKSLREKMSFNWHYYLFKYIYTVPLIRILLNMQFGKLTHKFNIYCTLKMCSLPVILKTVR